ncbi:MAG: C40 family peptidase, partial [Betaproteobacteria bacterium]
STKVTSAAVVTALTMVGKPYRRGGNSPAGFDCSGLVQYSYADAGVAMPRDTRGLRLVGTRVQTRELAPGDLLFFDQDGRSRSHVGIYIGDDRFVHAPSTGGKVRIDRTDAPFWRRHFIEARRL